MKRLGFAVFGLFASSLVWAKTLDTPHYKITINCQSPEYEVSCEKASYHSVDKATGEKLDLIGNQITKLCADGQAPCHSLGYEFTNGNLTYFISEAGQLQITDGAEVLVDESGTWID